MIIKAEPRHLPTLIDYVYTCQHTGFYSGYLSLDKSKMMQELDTAVQQGEVWIAITQEVQGVLVGHYDKTRDVCDLAGPYVKHRDVSVGLELIDHWILSYPDTTRHQFFFDRQSRYTLNLMAQLQAVFKGHESILRLERASFIATEVHTDVKPMRLNQKEQVRTLHAAIFPDVYLSPEALTREQPDHTVYVLNQHDTVIGYGLVKVTGTQASLEVFAIAKAHRGQHLAKPFITTMIAETFALEDVNTVQLVVENLNCVALNLYQSIGFTLHRENCSYQLNPSGKR